MKKSKEPINRISMAIAMLFVSLAIHAQRFVNTSLEGAQSVCAITQDSDGMIWLGTDNGLYSYDGYHGYRHFRNILSAIRVSMRSVSRAECSIWLLATAS